MRTLLVLPLLLVATACAVRVDPFEPASLGTQRVVRRAWEPAVARTYASGDTVASFVEGRALRRQSGWATASEPFTVSSGNLALRGDAGERFEVRGRTSVNSRAYTAVDVIGPGELAYSLLIDQRGVIADRVLRGMELLTSRFTVVPASARLELEVTEEFDPGAPFLHRELAFAGVSGGMLRLQVREYGPGDSGEPLSMSEREFPAEAGTIEVGGWTLRVDSAAPSGLECAIVDDGFVRG